MLLAVDKSQVGSSRQSPAATPLTPDRISWGVFARLPPHAAGSGGTGRQHSFCPLSPPPSSNPSKGALQQRHNGDAEGKSSPTEAARTTTSSRDDVSINEMDVTERVIQDEPGVYIIVRELTDGTRELQRVRFRSCVPDSTSLFLQQLPLELLPDLIFLTDDALQTREVCRAECEAVVGGEQGKDTHSVPLRQEW
jgi:hypothetical protein